MSSAPAPHAFAEGDHPMRLAVGFSRPTAVPQPQEVALEIGEVALLQACVGFHAKSQTDPGIRDRLYRLWCKLEEIKAA